MVNMGSRRIIERMCGASCLGLARQRLMINGGMVLMLGPRQGTDKPIPQHTRTMAGHSKWANIRHIKASKDKAKASMFEKAVHMMKVAVTEGGSADPKINTKLAKAVEYARSNNMPVANINNALQNLQKSQANAKPFTHLLKGPGGLYLLVEFLTDNKVVSKNKINSVIRRTSISEATGKAQNLFDEQGVIVTEASCDLDTATNMAISVGAEEVVQQDETFVFTCSPNDLDKVREGLEQQNSTVIYASVDFLPKIPATIDESEEEKLSIIVEKLENIQGVIKVHLNL